METLAFEDRRTFYRFGVNLPLRYRALNGKLRKRFIAETQNICADGLGIISNAELIPATPLEIWLDIPDDGEALHAKGEVVWARACPGNKFIVGISLKETDFMGISRLIYAPKPDANTQRRNVPLLKRLFRFFKR
ncbi:MAG: PilZ domain-containing protein [Candidatus Omnitrophota bacterium]